MRKVGICFTGGPYTVQQTRAYVRRAEAVGFDSAWAADDIGGRDPFTQLGAWSTVTERLRLGTAVTNPHIHHPVALAAIIATLDEASNGRAILGLGTGASWRSLIADRWVKPVAHMRECIRVIRELWSQDATVLDGTPVSLRDSLWVWPDGPPASFRKTIPVYMGARGPLMTRLAGQISDGLLIETCKFKSTIESQIKNFRAAVAEFGRDPQGIDCAPLIIISVSEKSNDFGVIRRFVAFQVSRLEETTAVDQGFDLDAFHKIKAIYATRVSPSDIVKYGTEPAAWEAAPYVTQEMLDAFAVTGTPDECLQKLERYLTIGANLPILLPLGCDVPLALEVGQALARKT